MELAREGVAVCALFSDERFVAEEGLKAHLALHVVAQPKEV